MRKEGVLTSVEATSQFRLLRALNPMTQTERGGADFRNIDFDANRHVAEIDLVSSSVLSSNNGVGSSPSNVRRHQERSIAIISRQQSAEPGHVDLNQSRGGIDTERVIGELHCEFGSGSTLILLRTDRFRSTAAIAFCFWRDHNAS